MSHSAAGVLALAITLMTSSAYAADISEAKVNATPPKPAAFDLYDCTKVGTAFKSSHYSQVVNGTYQEWVQSYQPTTDKQQIICITSLKPTQRQLTAAEATTLLSDSQKVGQPAPAGTAVAAPASAAINNTPVSPVTSRTSTTLPLGVSADASATPSSDAAAASSVPSADGVGRSTPQQLTPAQNGKYAVVDGGYGKTLASASQKQADAAVEPPATIGVDDRVRVGDTSQLPWSLIGQLVVTWKDGTQTVCTGTLVSPYVVLSAGQCAHNRDRGGFAATASFAPGQHQDSANGGLSLPNGARYADYVETNNRWTQISGGQTIQTIDARSDYAAFYFATPWTFTKTFMPILYGDTSSSLTNTAGYPTDASGSTGVNQDMWYSSGTETSRSVSLLRSFQVREYSADVSAGENGAPFWDYDGTTRSITGVVSYGGDEVSGGVWFGGENISIVTALMGWTPTQASPVHLADNLQAPIAIPSGDASSDSYILLYNPTAQNGSATITFNDGETGQLLGTWNSPTLGPFTSPQFRVQDMETAAGISPTGHSRYTLQMSANFPGYFQEILWNCNGVSLTNISGCGNGLSNDVIHLGNVHSSLFADYPSVVLAHNVGSKAADAVLGVYDAGTGQRLGGVVIPSIPAEASAAFRINDVENALGFKPGPNQFHYNLVQEGDFSGYLQHLVYNTQAGVITNMTAKCAFPLH